MKIRKKSPREKKWNLLQSTHSTRQQLLKPLQWNSSVALAAENGQA
jgi:hypothetical protein